MAKKNIPLILLASSSPRRIELLNHLGLRVKVHPPRIREVRKPRESALLMVLRLSREKALSVAKSEKLGSQPRIVLAADTTVVSPNGRLILGKPPSVRAAGLMLGMLSGQTHTVFTGYTLIFEAPGQERKVLSRVIRSRVTLRKLSRSSIQAYIKTGEPMDKAGAYAAQGLGMALVEKIVGSYSNVVGLPVAHVLRDIESLLKLEPLEWASKR